MKKAFISTTIIIIVINLIIINLHSSQTKKTYFFNEDLVALAGGEEGGDSSQYKYCITGDKLTSGTTSAGIIAIYCGDCLGARIWPTGDGECRRY